MRRVLLCGKSLLISGLQASLGMMPNLDVQLVDNLPDHIRERITAWNPEVLILEADQIKKTFSLLSLQEFPQMKIIGLGIEDNSLLVFSGSTCYEPPPEQLLQVIEG